MTKTNLVFNGKCGRSLAFYDRESLSWKTLQTTLPWGSKTFSDRWPRSGMMRSGSVYPLSNLEYLARGTCYSSLPTPCASDAWNRRDSRKRFTREGTASYNLKKSLNPACQNLYTAVIAMDPNTEDDQELNPQFVEWMMGIPVGWTELEKQIVRPGLLDGLK